MTNIKEEAVSIVGGGLISWMVFLAISILSYVAYNISPSVSRLYCYICNFYSNVVLLIFFWLNMVTQWVS